MSRERFVVGSLIRSEQPAHAAAEVSRRFAALAAELPQGSTITLSWSSGRRAGTVELAVEVAREDGSPSRDDVAWALDGAAQLAKRAVPASMPPPVRLFELVPPHAKAVTRSPVGFIANEPAEPADGKATWPAPRFDSGYDLLAVLSETNQVSIRVHLAPASDSEIVGVRGAVTTAWSGSSSEALAYIGRPVRVRAFLGVAGEPLTTRLLALTRRWLDGLEVVALDAQDERNLRSWNGDGCTLAGHAAPTGVALALTRLPVAGSEIQAGVRIRPPVARPRPLDPVPRRPRQPIRLGKARRVDGSLREVAAAASDLDRHMQVIGTTGSGKSSFLAGLVHEVAAGGGGATVLDPHGTLVDRILDELPPDRLPDVRLVRSADLDNPVPINVLAGPAGEQERVVSAVTELMREMFDPHNQGIVGPRWERWFALSSGALTALLGPRAPLTAVPLVSRDQDTVRDVADAIARDHPDLAASLIAEIGALSSRESADLIAWAVSKFQRLVGSPHVRAALQTGADAVDAVDVMDNRRILLIDLAMPSIGTDAARMLGTLWLLKHALATGSRQHRDRTHLLVVDEAHLFQHGALPSLLSEGRKFGIGAAVAHQHQRQLASSLAHSLDANSGTLLAFRTGVGDAHRLVARLEGWEPGDLTRLPALHAATVLSRDGVTTEPFTLVVDHNDRVRRRRLTEGEAQARRERARNRSHALLVQPHRALKAFDAAELARSVRAARENLVRDERPARARVAPQPRLNVPRVLTEDIPDPSDYGADVPEDTCALQLGLDLRTWQP